MPIWSRAQTAGSRDEPHPKFVPATRIGARTTTASLGMVNDRAKSQIPGLGYTVTYAVGNTLLTIWGMIIVLLMT